MRIWHRLKIFVPLLLLLSWTADCVAQPMMVPPSFGEPAFMAGGQPTYAATNYQGMPESFRPHPSISPFENAFEQHYMTDGLWFRRALGGFGPGASLWEYDLNVDFIRTKSRRLRGLIGDPKAATFLQDSIINNNGSFPDIMFFDVFREKSAGIVPDLWQSGLRMSGTVENRTGWGMSWNVQYNGRSSDDYDARAHLERMRLDHIDAITLEASGGVANGPLNNNLRMLNERQILETQILNARLFDAANAETFGVLGGTDDILDRSLYPYGSIPLQNGIDIDGFAQLFDLDYIVKHEIESYGSGFHFSFSPVYEKDSLRVRPIIGARVMRINEFFGFRGVDSGLAYTFNLPNGLDDDGDFILDNVDEDGTLNFTELTPDATQEILVRSFVNSRVRSTLTGPEIGVEYLMGESKGISFNGSTRVGALYNTEKSVLTGDNIGDTATTTIDVNTGNTVLADMFDTTTAGGQLTQNAFRDQRETNHISPMFEQSLNVQLPIFSRVPILRDCWQLETARLQAGWTFLYVGEVSDPSQSIVWISRPVDGIFPHLKESRGNFYQNTLSLGINWEF